MKWNGRSTAAKLKTAEKAELLARWRATMGTPPPFAPNRELLAMALAWQLQERKYGGLKPLVQRRVEALTNAYRRGKLPAALLQPCSFRPGTTLVKLWRGRRHTVIALPYGFRYQGKIYRSLTAIAHEITGTHQNGAAFFGLRDVKGLAGSRDQVRLRPRGAGVQAPPMAHQQVTCANERQVIAEPESWQRLVRTVAPDRRKHASAEQSDSGALLAGLIFDETGRPLRPIRVNQGARRYRFYMSQAQREEAAGLRLPAHQLEKLVLETTLEALKAEVGTRALARKLAGAGERVRRQFLRLIVKRAEVGPNLIRLKMHGMSCQLFEQPVHVTVGALPSMPAAIEIQHEFSPASGALGEEI